MREMEIERSMGDSAKQEARERVAQPQGWHAIKYIIGNESFEKLASMSLIGNITMYLKTRYNLNGIFLVTVVTIWNGSSNIACLAGAFLSDTYLGRFNTLLFGSISSLLGMATMTLTAGVRELRPPGCPMGDSVCVQPEKWQLGVLFLGLALLSAGAGGIRPCNIAFGADQFDTSTKKGKAQLNTFVNWWYLSFTVALLISLTGVVYIQTNISWLIGFAIPTACLAFSIAIFLAGRHTYVYAKPQGSVFLDMAKVTVASLRKHKVVIGPPQEQENDLYNPRHDPYYKQTDILRFLEKAAVIVSASEVDKDGVSKNGWRLCSVKQVEQFKCLVSVVPVWVSGIGCFIVMEQQGVFGVLQAIQMDRSIGWKKFKIPPAWTGITSMLTLSIWILIYEYAYVPLGRKVLRSNPRLSVKQRMRVGIVMAITCMVISGVVEQQRREAALRHGSFESPLSVVALLPQFVFSGLTEAFAVVAMMEFLTLQMPESMRTVAGAIFFLSLSVSSYLCTFIVNLIHKATERRGKAWLGGHDLNNNRLDYYYYIIATIGIVNFVYFHFLGSRYIMFDQHETKNSSSTQEKQLSKFSSQDTEKGLATD